MANQCKDFAVGLLGRIFVLFSVKLMFKYCPSTSEDMFLDIEDLLILYSSAKYSFVAQQYPSLLHNAVISAYNSFAFGVSLLSYLTLAGSIA